MQIGCTDYSTLRNEYLASAKMTPVLREAMLCYFEARCFVASDYNENVPRRVCGHLLKPCFKQSCSGYLFVMHCNTKHRKYVDNKQIV